MKKKASKSKSERVKKYGEVFTPPELVEEMLDHLPSSSWEEDKTFLDPCRGTGNFLVAILRRKLLHGHEAIKALSTIYGCDILPDTLTIAKERLVSLIWLRRDVPLKELFPKTSSGWT